MQSIARTASQQPKVLIPSVALAATKISNLRSIATATDTNRARICGNIPFNLNENLAENDKIFLRSVFPKLSRDPLEPSRLRAYSKFDWNLKDNSVEKDNTCTGYSQSTDANDLDGGKIRQFQPLDSDITESSALKTLIDANLNLIKENFDLKNVGQKIPLGIHFIRYQCDSAEASFSSPIWLHRDDEPAVGLNVIDKSDNLVGGHSILAQNPRKINYVKDLKPFEGILLSREGLHAVTPMQSDNSKQAHRDIVLVTILSGKKSINLM